MRKLILGILIAFLLPLSANPTPATSVRFVTGGGIITGGHGINSSKIAFGVQVVIDEAGECSGNLQVIFYNTNNDALDQGIFISTEFTYIAIGTASFEYPAGVFTDYEYASIGANGQFNGEDDWSIRINLADFGKRGKSGSNTDILSDALQIRLIDNTTGETVYDTPQDFSTEQELRTTLAGGNIVIYN